MGRKTPKIPLEERPHVLYEITNNINGKKYTGITWEPKERWSGHKTTGRSKDRGKVVHDAMRKYGVDNFTFTIVSHFPNRKTAADAEIAAIATKQFKYNTAPGGEGGSGPHTEETKLKISKVNKGRKRTPEQNERNRQAKLGKKQSPEAIEKSAASRRGRPLTEEHRKKLSDLQKGKKKSPEAVEKNRQSHLGLKQSAETIANRVAKNTGQKRTGEALTNLQESRKKRAEREKAEGIDHSALLSEEARQVISQKLTGIKRSPETIQKLKDAWVRRKQKELEASLVPPDLKKDE